jgi:hypothetical protein
MGRLITALHEEKSKKAGGEENRRGARRRAAARRVAEPLLSIPNTTPSLSRALASAFQPPFPRKSLLRSRSASALFVASGRSGRVEALQERMSQRRATLRWVSGERTGRPRSGSGEGCAAGARLRAGRCRGKGAQVEFAVSARHTLPRE